MTSYLYLIAATDVSRFKVGHSNDPIARIRKLQSQTPNNLEFARVLAIRHKGHAETFEAFVLSWLTQCSAKGEWVTDVNAAHAVFDEICPAVDVTEEFSAPQRPSNRERPRIWHTELEQRLALADRRMADHLSWASNSRVGGTGRVGTSDLAEYRAGQFHRSVSTTQVQP